MDNDGHCAALGERHFGQGQDVQHFVTLIVGTGIGGGLVLDGEVWRGARNAAGELGHVVVDAAGPPCSCGNRGCVESFASGSGLAARARALIASEGQPPFDTDPAGEVSAEALGRAAAGGHAGALAVIADGGRALGVALSSLLNVLNPQRVILGGPVLRLGDAFVGPLRAEVAARALPTARDSCDIVLSDLDDAALLGAAALVLFA